MGIHHLTTKSTILGDRKKVMAYCFSPTCVRKWLLKNHKHYIKHYNNWKKLGIEHREMVLAKIESRTMNSVTLWTKEKEKALQNIKKCYTRARNVVAQVESSGDPALNGVPKPDVTDGIECPQCGWALRWVPKIREDEDVRSSFRGIGGFSTVELPAGIRERYSKFVRDSEGDSAGGLEEEVC